MTYAMTCSCGEVMRVDASTRAEAVSKMKALMTKDAVSAHMLQKHPGEKALAVAQVHQMIERGIKAVS